MKTTSSSGSSLQRAAAVGRVIVTAQKGDFEACFAGGLDLSEFLEGTTAPAASGGGTTSTSHAAALLQVKHAESAAKRQQENEEAQMQDTVRKRTEQLKEAVWTMPSDVRDVLRAPPPPLSSERRQSPLDLLKSRNNNNNAGLNISALLVGMHGAEQKDEPRHKSQHYTKQQKRIKANDRKKQSKQQATGTSKQQVAKKSKRSKY
jgi:hypothetical protein